ncbi:MAG: beta-lactamase family protein [Algicola sp.]|nr:beta-lactamase family protein [Algicola sp.]
MRIFLIIGVIFFCSVPNAKGESDSLAVGIDAVVTKFMAKSKYTGLSIAAYNKGKMRFNQSYGYSNHTTLKPFTTHESIALGSNIKTLVAAAILLLEENNKLKLTDKLAQHLPFKLNQAQAITIEDMLCHVSDLPDVFGGDGYDDYEWQKAKSQKEFIDQLNQSKRKISPKVEYRYNNTAYFLLGLVIEHISHQPLGDYFRAQIFSPLHLDHAYYLGDSYYYPQLTKMYQLKDGAIADYEDPVEYRIVAGAGALGGDITAYSKLFSGILTGDVLAETSKTKMKTPCRLADGSFAVNRKKQQTGLGIEISQMDDQRVFSRGGAMNGHVSAIVHFEKTGLTMAIVGNTFMRLAPVLDSIFEQKLHHQFN